MKREVKSIAARPERAKAFCFNAFARAGRTLLFILL